MEKIWSEEILGLINESEEAINNYYKNIEPLNESVNPVYSEIEYKEKENKTINASRTLRELLEDSELK